jgi:hypothetical protein
MPADIKALMSRMKTFREKQPPMQPPEEVGAPKVPGGGVDNPETPSFLDKDEDLGFEGGPPSDELKNAVEEPPGPGSLEGEEPEIDAANPENGPGTMDDPLSGMGGSMGGGLGGDEEPEIEADKPPEPPPPEEKEPEYPKERDWQPITPLDGDMKSLEFMSGMSGEEGFYLRMKKLDVAGLWLATLYKKVNDEETKVIDYGQVSLPKDVEDPITYIKELANTVLDHGSMRYQQQLLKYNAAKEQEPSGLGETMPELGEVAPEAATGDGILGGEEQL